MEPIQEIQQTQHIIQQVEKPPTRDNRDINEILQTLRSGTVLWKIRSKKKEFLRTYILDDSNYVLRYQPSHKPGCYMSDRHQEINMEDIHDVRKGWKTDNFNKISKKIGKKPRTSSQASPIAKEDCCFSVIYGAAKQSLDLVAPDAKSADMWVQGLRKIVDILNNKNRMDIFESYLKQQFEEADKDKNKCLNFDEVCQLAIQLNVKMTKEEARKQFDAANTEDVPEGGQQVLHWEEFLGFFKTLMKRPEIVTIFKQYAKNDTEMDKEELFKFLKEEQGMSLINVKDCLQAIEVFEPSAMKARGKISITGFTHMLMSEKHDIFNYDHRFIYQDMTQPLSHYYMASSHNTYLTGGQLKGESSLEGYIDALNRGCRCVELDCWDGADGEPIVYHGYTLTTKINFRDILVDAIKPYAFKVSHYPVVLSLENHCSEAQQKKMAQYMTEVFVDNQGKSMIYTEDVKDLECLPSPEDLKFKIIIKGKKITSVEKEEDSNSDSGDEDEEKDATKVVKSAVAKELSDLVSICQSVHFKGFEHSTNNEKCYQMSSFAEAKATKLIDSSAADFIEYNKCQLSRIYPAGSRTRSTNFKPTPYWNVGCQIVALNYQSCRQPVFMNEAKFRQNGGCGYLLKPAMLREPLNSLPKEQSSILLKIRVISGQYIPNHAKDVVDPYVKIKIIGHPDDDQSMKTLVIEDNGLNPTWEHEMEFPLQYPELAMIGFVVKDENRGTNPVLGIYALSVTSLGKGYRHVFLMDYARKQVTPASLFVHVSIAEIPQVKSKSEGNGTSIKAD